MNTSLQNSRAFVARLAILLAASCAIAAAGPTVASQLAVRGELVYPISGPAIENGVVLLDEGRIVAVGPAAEVAIPEGTPVLEAAIVTPGLVDTRSVLGLAGALNAKVDKDRSVRVQDQDQLETSDPLQPELRAIDAYDPQESLIEWVRSLGVTTVHTGHAPGAVVSGQTMILKTTGLRVEDASIVDAAGLAITLGSSVASNFEAPGTRAKTVAVLRQALVEAEDYRRKMADSDPAERPERNLRSEALAALLSGELAAVVTAERAPEIAAALRLQREFGLRLWLDGCAECYLLLDEIRAANVPVLIHPTMARPGGERRNLAFDTAARLHAAGIPFAFESGYETYVPKVRVLLWEAAMAVRYGLPAEAALAALTLDAARILGVDERVGSLEAGKDGDLVLFDGDPFEFTSHVCGVVIEGEVVSDRCR